MGLFSDLKEDLSQAMDELLPDENRMPRSILEDDELEKELLSVVDDDSDFSSDDALEELAADIDAALSDDFEDAKENETQFENASALTDELTEAETNPDAVFENRLSEAAETPLSEAEADSLTGESFTGESFTAETMPEPVPVQLELDLSTAPVSLKKEDIDGSTFENTAAEQENTAKGAMDEMEESLESLLEEMGDNTQMDMEAELANRPVTDEVSVITAGMKIKGDISSDGSMDVLGTIEGNVSILGKLNVTGEIVGNSKATEVYAENARITGEISSEGSIKVGQNSIIIGNLFASSAVIAGAIKGDIDVKGPVILDTSAIVMGNIKSKSVQINNGAVIEGMCSQTYADVNPTSFFEQLKGKVFKK